MRLLKYLEPTFAQDGPVELRDERGQTFTARIDHAGGRVWGLHDLYHSHNLGVNDVLVLHELEQGRVQVDCIVKPAERPGSAASRERLPDPPRRVVVNESAYVREVRLERPAPPRPTPEPSSAPEPTERPGPARAEASQAGVVARPAAPGAARAATAPVSSPEPRAAQQVATTPAQVAAAQPAETTQAQNPELQLRELASLTGYAFDRLAPGVLRLHANMAGHGYSVLIALSETALASPAWKEPCDYHALLVSERDRPQGVPRLTVEALETLIEHARLTPLSPIELRGYWNTGSFDQESVASLAELVSAQLAQRGTLSFVLMILGQQPAHSVVSLPRLAERLGSGVNAAELRSVLDGLSRPPFSLLTPLNSAQFYLRSDVDATLRDLAGYAEGLRRRLDARALAAD